MNLTHHLIKSYVSLIGAILIVILLISSFNERNQQILKEDEDYKNTILLQQFTYLDLLFNQKYLDLQISICFNQTDRIVQHSFTIAEYKASLKDQHINYTFPELLTECNITYMLALSDSIWNVLDSSKKSLKRRMLAEQFKSK